MAPFLIFFIVFLGCEIIIDYLKRRPFACLASRRYNSNINTLKADTGDIMKKSGIILVAMAFIVAVASLAVTAGAVCTTCGGEENWEASAASFLEGKPINDEPSSLSNPQQSRIRNDFKSNLLKEGADDSTTNLAEMPSLNITLMDARAVPNPVNSGSPVMITAVFGNSSSSSSDNATMYNVSASIKNPDEIVVGNADLQRTSGGEYAGIWLANVPAGVYKATIIASLNETSKMFNDTLQIEII
jgi:hypothetical protein